MSKCPLNACCSRWSYCGLTFEFCENKCGYGNLHTDTRGDFENIVYWLDSTGPLAYDPNQLNDKYTRVHYAFVNINSDFSIDDSKISVSDFLNIKSKKVASFGGWDFSTDPLTYKIFRDGVKSENRAKLATNIANFAIKYNLDGIDLDWEYPEAPGIPGFPADSKDSSINYLEFIKLLKSKLGSKTLSMAILLLFWYLKNFPIKDMDNFTWIIKYL